MLEWAREWIHCDWDSNTMRIAAEQGNLEMVKYCVAKKCPINGWACAEAAGNGHLEVLKYLREEAKAPWDGWSVFYALEKNQPECVQYLFDNNCPLPPDWPYERGELS